MLSHPDIPDPCVSPLSVPESAHTTASLLTATTGPLIKRRVLSHPFQPCVPFTPRPSLQLYRPPSAVPSLPLSGLAMVCGHCRCMSFTKKCKMVSKVLEMTSRKSAVSIFNSDMVAISLSGLTSICLSTVTRKS